MKPSRKFAVAGGLALVPLLAGGFMLQSRQTQDNARLLEQVMQVVNARFVDTVSAAGLYEKAARGLVHELNDPYTVLFSPKDFTNFSTQTNGKYGGVGMQIGEVQGAITVDKVFPHTPAEDAGVQEGDKIIMVDTASTRGWKIDQVSNTLKGTPGTQVNVQFSRPGQTQPIKVRLTRREIHIPAVPYAMMLDGKVGYVPLLQFSETAAPELQDAMQSLVKQGAKGIVLDFRGNPGGILDQAIEMSNLFLKPGQEIVSVRGRNQAPQVTSAEAQPTVPTLPIVILTDGGTASAAEIVAGALQDHDRAAIVGTTSYGKGLVQTLYPLDGGYALKMTTAKWYTPSGRSIQRERKVVDGRFVPEEAPDSLEADSVKKSRPAYKSDAGRVIYGGGGITPDVIVKPDTISTVEQTFAKTLFGPKLQDVNNALAGLASDLKPQVAGNPSFTVKPEWREDFYKRLTAAGVPIDRKQFEGAQGYVDRLIDFRVARSAFGDSTAKRHEISDDVQLRRAMSLVQRASSQKDLLAMAEREQRTASAAEARTAAGTVAAAQK